MQIEQGLAQVREARAQAYMVETKKPKREGRVNGEWRIAEGREGMDRRELKASVTDETSEL